MTWDKIKQSGSEHYKTGTVEPIDLFRDLKPHESLTALEVKALTDCIKYAYRMLRKGTNTGDLGKIKHYTTMCEWRLEGQGLEFKGSLVVPKIKDHYLRAKENNDDAPGR
jgi:hypothetical protein